MGQIQIVAQKRARVALLLSVKDNNLFSTNDDSDRNECYRYVDVFAFSAVKRYFYGCV